MSWRRRHRKRESTEARDSSKFKETRKKSPEAMAEQRFKLGEKFPERKEGLVNFHTNSQSRQHFHNRLTVDELQRAMRAFTIVTDWNAVHMLEFCNARSTNGLAKCPCRLKIFCDPAQGFVLHCAGADQKLPDEYWAYLKALPDDIFDEEKLTAEGKVADKEISTKLDEWAEIIAKSPMHWTWENAVHTYVTFGPPGPRAGCGRRARRRRRTAVRHILTAIFSSSELAKPIDPNDPGTWGHSNFC